MKNKIFKTLLNCLIFLQQHLLMEKNMLRSCHQILLIIVYMAIVLRFWIKNKLKQLLSELKKFKVQTILVLVYKKRNDRKIFHWSVKLIASDSDIDEAFISMHQSIMTRIKQYANEDWIVLDVIIKQSIKIFGC